MTEASADPVAAYLAEVRRHIASYKILRDTHPLLIANARLLAAVEAAHGRHRPEGVTSEFQPCERHDIWPLPPVSGAIHSLCPDCTVTMHARCCQSSCPDEWPCPDYEAITAALLGVAE